MSWIFAVQRSNSGSTPLLSRRSSILSWKSANLCIDLRYGCPKWVEQSPKVCQKNPSFMREQCQKSCRFCWKTAATADLKWHFYNIDFSRFSIFSQGHIFAFCVVLYFTFTVWICYLWEDRRNYSTYCQLLCCEFFKRFYYPRKFKFGFCGDSYSADTGRNLTSISRPRKQWRIKSESNEAVASGRTDVWPLDLRPHPWPVFHTNRLIL